MFENFSLNVSKYNPCDYWPEWFWKDNTALDYRGIPAKCKGQSTLQGNMQWSLKNDYLYEEQTGAKI